MKVEQQVVTKPAFVPVVITIESQEELDRLVNYLGKSLSGQALPQKSYGDLKDIQVGLSISHLS